MINDITNGDSDENIEFEFIKATKSSTSSSTSDFESISSQFSQTTTNADLMPLMDWITLGPMDDQIYRKNDVDSNMTQFSGSNEYKVDDQSSDDSYTFPEDRVRNYYHYLYYIYTLVTRLIPP